MTFKTDQQSLVTRAYNLYKRQGYISLQMLQKELSIGYNMAVALRRLVLERIAKDGDDE
jgi:DNA segregation ATPase FtsK/SpoIIIE-like protein